MHRLPATIRTLCLVLVVVLTGCSGAAPVSEGPDTTPTAAGPTTTTTATGGTVAVHNINVGQSTSTLVVGPTGETMLIDTGDFNDDGELVLAYLQRHDIDRIDHLVVTHNDADHIGGNAAVIEYYETEADGIGAIHDPGIAASTNTYEEYLDAVERHDVRLLETREGDRIDVEGVDVQVLGPSEPYLADGARNENSIVLRLEYGRTSFLWTGDAEAQQEAYLVEHYGPQLNSTVYKAGHHGSGSSSSGPLLNAASPEAAVISSAYQSRYGHPHEEVLQRLADRSIPAYWTAVHGDIVLVTDGETISVRTQASATTDSLSLRDASSVQPGSTAPVEERARIGAAPAGTAAATETATAIATDGGTDTDAGTGELVLETINADAAGDDRENLDDEYVVFRNAGDETLALGGWTVRDESGKTYAFPDGFTLAAGASVRLHTGSGTDTDTDLYWDAGRPVWNNGGDTVIVENNDGETVIEEAY
jgi:competence protein ComEC